MSSNELTRMYVDVHVCMSVEVMHAYVCGHARMYVCTRGTGEPLGADDGIQTVFTPLESSHLSVQTMAYRRQRMRCRDRAEGRAEIATSCREPDCQDAGGGSERSDLREDPISERSDLREICDVWPTDGVHMRCTYAEVRRVPVHICICAYGSRLGRVPGCVVCGVSRANVLVCISERSIGGSCRRLVQCVPVLHVLSSAVITPARPPTVAMFKLYAYTCNGRSQHHHPP